MAFKLSNPISKIPVIGKAHDKVFEGGRKLASTITKPLATTVANAFLNDKQKAQLYGTMNTGFGKQFLDPLGAFRQDQPSELPTPGALNTQELGDLELARQKRLEQLQKSENELRGALIRRTTDVGSAIDEELKQLSKQVGYNFGQQKEAEAGNAAERGVLRSSFTGQRMGEIAGEELKQQGELATQARAKKFAVSDAARKALDDIATRREQLADAIREQEIEGLQNFNANAALQDLQQQFDAQLTKIEMDAQQRAAQNQALGGMAQTAMMIALL